MTKFALQARWVLPIETPPLAGGVVTIHDDRIVSVAEKPEDSVELYDLGDVILLPGFVNAHTHLEFSELMEPLGQPGMALPDWIRGVISSRKQQTDTVVGMCRGLEESLRAGVTTIGEIATSKLSTGSSNLQPELLVFQEVIGFSAGRVDSVFAELAQRVQEGTSAYRLGISPHAPYTVHPALLEKLVELAVEKQLPVAMHLAESPEELQLMRGNAGPFRALLEERSMWDNDVFSADTSPSDYLRVLAQAPRSLVIHGNYLSRAEIDFVAERSDQMSIVYCPRTHAYFGHPEYPLPAMLEAGTRVAIGTDSRASNPDLSLIAELRHIAKVYPSISPDQVVALGTINGARALGLEDLVGSLAAGKLANLTAIECDGSESSPYAAVVHLDRQPIMTWLRGRAVSFTDS